MKKVLSMVLAVLFVLTAFVSCGKGNETPAVSGEGNNAATEATLLLGGIGPLTGPAASYGQAVKDGAQLAVDEINAAGGVNGMKLELNFQDDEHDAEKSVNAYNALMDAGMKLLIGTVTSNPCVAVAAEAAEDNVFLLTPSGSAVECIKNDNAFRICFSDPNQGIGAADYIAENAVAEKIAVIYNSSDVYSQGIYEKFNAEAAEKNLTIVAAEAFTKDSATDFSVQLQKIKDSGADLLFLPIYYQEAALILEQASKLGLDVKYFGCDGLDGIIDQLGADKAALAEGVMLLTPFAADADDEKTQKFTAAYKAAYNDAIPTQFAADGYDAIYTVKAAIEKAGITDANISASDLCDALVKAMVEITVDGVTGEMTWDASGEPEKTPKAMVIKDGSYSAM
ncbi:MAG: ABC transporter substrate-binding protein [Clostridia bacterium]|nr:ABC transporter substrate-binding protein [Clostridia bacterium]